MTLPVKRDKSLSLREVFDEINEEFFSLDRGLPGTFLRLCWRPREVIRAYLDERSRRFTRPLRYLLIAIALSLLVGWLAYDHFGAVFVLGETERRIRESEWLVEHSALLTLLFLPLLAVVIRLCFFGLNVRYIDALVTLGYTQAQVHLFSLILPIWHASVGNRWIDLPVTGLVLAYLVWAWSSVADGPLWRRLPAAVLALILAQTLNGLMVAGLLWLSAW